MAQLYAKKLPSRDLPVFFTVEITHVANTQGGLRMRLTLFSDYNETLRDNELLSCSECGTHHKVLPALNDAVPAFQYDAPRSSILHPHLHPRPRGPAAYNNRVSAYQEGLFLQAVEDMATPMRPFVNYYAALGLPLVANSEQIYDGYQQRLRDLIEAQKLRDSRAKEEAAAPSLGPAAVALRAGLLLRLGLRVTSAADAELDRLRSGESEAPMTIANDNMNDLWQFKDRQAIIDLNNIGDAYNILSHPVKKKLYDMTYFKQLQAWEGERVADLSADQVKRKKAFKLVKKWRSSLMHGHKEGTEYDEGEFNRVKSLKGFGKQERCIVPSSMMCGEVVAGFVDGMELG